eukprot:scaffold316869_cov19-Tisochrysis_lutea.AAC.1
MVEAEGSHQVRRKSQGRTMHLQPCLLASESFRGCMLSLILKAWSPKVPNAPLTAHSTLNTPDLEFVETPLATFRGPLAAHFTFVTPGLVF